MSGISGHEKYIGESISILGGNMLYNSRKWRKNIKVIINYDTFRIFFGKFF